MSRFRSTGTAGRLRLRTITSKWYSYRYLVVEADKQVEEEYYIQRVTPPKLEGREGSPDGRVKGKT